MEEIYDEILQSVYKSIEARNNSHNQLAIEYILNVQCKIQFALNELENED